MTMEFQPSTPASAGVELPEGAFVKMHATEVNANSSVDGSHESGLEFLSVNVDGSNTVSDLEYVNASAVECPLAKYWKTTLNLRQNCVVDRFLLYR